MFLSEKVYLSAATAPTHHALVAPYDDLTVLIVQHAEGTQVGDGAARSVYVLRFVKAHHAL